MTRILLIGAAAVLFTTGAYAAGDNMGGTNAMGGTTNMSTMSCNDMMTKAKGMAMPTDPMKMKTANDEMKMAKDSMASGDEAGCKTHMTNAMGAMGGGM